MNFVEIKKNRVISGEFLSVQDILGKLSYIYLLFMIMALIVNHFEKFKWISGALVVINLILLMEGIKNFSIYFSLSQRISLGIGFIFMFITLYTLVRENIFHWAFVGIIAYYVFTRQLDTLALIQEYYLRKENFINQLLIHLGLSLGSASIAYLISSYITKGSLKSKKFENIAYVVMNLIQTIPTLGILGIMMFFFGYVGLKGIGIVPSMIVLTGFSLLPIVSYNLSGIRSIDQDVIESAKSIGMNEKEIYKKILIPISYPSRLGGFRVAIVQSFGNAIIAGLVGGGGLGTIIFLGLAQGAYDLVLLGSFTVVFLSLTFDSMMEKYIYLVRRRLV
jgi:osmoprotectant transport system permease protein